MKAIQCVALYAVTTVILLCGTGWAQSNGTVKGTVRDSSGAILPGATITLTATATQRVQTAVTTETGSYVFSAVPPGEYSLTIDLPGFKKLVRQSLTVQVTETVLIDAILEVGEISQEITVKEEAPLVQTTESSLGRVVEQAMITGVPLSSRNFTQILALSPGVTSDVPNASAYGRNSVNISANGARPWENSVVLNGIIADNVNSLGFDDGNDKTGVPIPSPDAIQEFKVQTGLYDAEYGRQGGASVNMVTKTGTNAVHGSVFEFLRNDALNANEFFRNSVNQPRGAFKQNQFGATLGGPIAKDRTFYFLSYQGTRQRNAVSSASTSSVFLPLLGNRSAQALGELYGGKSGQQGGVKIAPDGSNINPIALALVNAKLPDGTYAIPDPQTILANGTGFSALAATTKFKEDQVIADFDHSFSAANRLAVKFLYANLPATLPFETSGSNVLGFGEVDGKSNLHLSITDTHTFSPTVLNELRIGYGKNYMIQNPVEPLSATQFGLTRPVTDRGDKLPLLQVAGLFTLGPQQNNQQTIILYSYELADTLHFVKGKHDLRVGANINPNRERRIEVYLIRGKLVFQSFPDFLLGMSAAQNGSNFSNISQSQAGNGIDGRHPRDHFYSAFVQDDFRANDRLTLNLGLRWQYYGGEIDARGRKANFDLRKANFGPIPPEGTLDGFVVPANADVKRLALLAKNSAFLPPNYILPTKGLMDEDTKKAFSPRIGMAFRPIASRNDFVIRAGYGIFFSSIAGNVFEQASFDPWLISVTAGGATANGATFQNPYTSLPPASSELPVYIPLKPGVNRTFLAIDPKMTLPYSQQWSMNWQYGIGNYLIEVGYIGSKGTHLIGSTQPNQALLASPEHPVHGETTNTIQNLNNRALTLEWLPNALSVRGSYFNSTYNSFQFSVKRQYSKDLTFMASYTLSHAIDNISAPNSGRGQGNGSYVGDFYNRAAAKGSADFDRRQRVVASYVYAVPGVFQDNAFGRNAFGGWSLSGVTTIQSGKPFSITDGTAGTIYGVSSYAQFAPGKSASDAMLTGRTQDRLNKYFDTSVFSPPPAVGNGTGFGNVGRNVLYGPGQVNFDMALKKAFRFPKTPEEQRVEFRVEFFNIFNHAQFANPASARSSPGSFGVISSTVVGPRILQMALRYQF